MTNKKIEDHPFPPILVNTADILMMGTFPPTANKWSMDFHYPNFYNDMWRVYGQVFFDNKDYFRTKNQFEELNKNFDPQRIIDFLHERNIASCPTVQQAIREEGNASDKHLTVIKAVDLPNILMQLPNVHSIFTTGGKATEILLEILNATLPENTPKKQQFKLPKTNQSIDFPFLDRSLTLYRLPSTSRAYPLSFDNKVSAYRDFFKKVGKI